MLTREEIKKRIREIGAEIGSEIKKVVCYEDSEKGRRGQRCYVQTGKKGVAIEVIGYVRCCPHFLLSFEVKEKAVTTKGGNKYEVLRILREKVINLSKNGEITNFIGETNNKFTRKNPRICEYNKQNFKRLWNLIQEGIPKIESAEARGRKLFERDYSLEKIIKRYRYAIENKDQVFLDLSRKLLEADGMDHIIAVNEKVSPYTYREHVVPCITLHNLLLQEIHDGGNKDDELKKLLKRHLKIVHIHKDEAKKLNSNGLRTDMPAKWGQNNSPYARLILNNVPIRNIKQGLCLSGERWARKKLLLR